MRYAAYMYECNVVRLNI